MFCFTCISQILIYCAFFIIQFEIFSTVFHDEFFDKSVFELFFFNFLVFDMLYIFLLLIFNLNLV